MEFFEEIKCSLMNVKQLHKVLSINNLPNLCSSISTIIRDDLSEGSIYCLWGEFDINREELRDGIRFSLPNCPNALAWSITLEKSINSLIIHCAINKKDHNQDFIESIEDFISAWKVGLSQYIENVKD
jgi:hypothetical protein